MKPVNELKRIIKEIEEYEIKKDFVFPNPALRYQSFRYPVTKNSKIVNNRRWKWAKQVSDLIDPLKEEGIFRKIKNDLGDKFWIGYLPYSDDMSSLMDYTYIPHRDTLMLLNYSLIDNDYTLAILFKFKRFLMIESPYLEADQEIALTSEIPFIDEWAHQFDNVYKSGNIEKPEINEKKLADIIMWALSNNTITLADLQKKFDISHDEAILYMDELEEQSIID